MSYLFLFIISSYGLTAIVIDSEIGESIIRILQPIPFVGKAAAKRCYMCMGFWSGVMCSSLVYPIYGKWYELPFITVFAGFAASGMCPLIAGFKAWFDTEELLKQFRK